MKGWASSGSGWGNGIGMPLFLSRCLWNENRGVRIQGWALEFGALGREKADPNAATAVQTLSAGKLSDEQVFCVPVQNLGPTDLSHAVPMARMRRCAG